MVQKDHAICDVLLETVTSQPALTALAGNQRSHTLFLQPAKQSPEFGANNGFIRQRGKERFERVQHDSLCADGVDCMTESEKQSLEIVFACFFDFGAFDKNV